MAAEHLYKGEEEYFGVLKAKPKVPEDEVWVFSRTNEQFPVACVWGTESLRPPSAPWFARFAMQIHKFYQSATFRWRFPLYEHFPLWLIVDVTTTLVDPVSYLLDAREASRLYNQPTKDTLQQNQLVKDALQKALRNILAFERQRDPLSPQKQQQSLEQVVPLTLSVLKSDNLSRLLVDGDLGLYLQNSPAIRKLGVRIQVIVRETEHPPVYNKIVKNLQRSLETELLEARELILAFKGDIASLGSILPREELLALGQRLYTNLGDYYEGKRPKIEPILGKLIEQFLRPARGNTDSALLAAIFFKDISGKEIEKPLQAISIATTREFVATRTPTEPISPEKQEDIRNKHISALYEAVSDINSETKDWQFSPKDRNKVKEIILIEVGNNGTIELQVPQGYPQVRPAVKAKEDKKPRYQKDVNELVQPIIARPEGYDLVSIVKAVALDLNPRISRSEPIPIEDEQTKQLPTPKKTVEPQMQLPVPQDVSEQQKQLSTLGDAPGQQRQLTASEDILKQLRGHPVEEETIQNIVKARSTRNNTGRVRRDQKKDSNIQKAEHIDPNV